MSDFDVKERQFEDDICNHLINNGYIKGNPKNFDRKIGIDVDTFIEFIKTSQPISWKRHVANNGKDAEKVLIERFEKETSREGILKVLRYGFKEKGTNFKIIFWKPETTMNKTTLEQYKSNVFHCTRQLHYSVKNENSLDIVLFINGIPLVSMELKCQFTGQNIKNAINQYKFDRSDKDTIFKFKSRVLVHFAVDLSNVYMTTKLEGAKTYFLPFNKGSNGAGKVGGKGNPSNKNGYDTSYLWEEVLEKDRLLEILQKYLHLEEKNNRMIFPRYHQLDVVTKLLKDVKEKGAGNNYLIQHSAGSGKSNSIAWLSYRLSSLHNENNEKIFQSVIIVTDRRVLDNQLQDTVYQFDHVNGVVEKIDKNAKQLQKAIENGTNIIITTLQKFPVIYKEVNNYNNNFAVIIDEAHSSQTGNSANKLKMALGDTDEVLKEQAEYERSIEENTLDNEDKILNELASHGKHSNLSFFAFTATPKDKTLNMFGTRDIEGKYHPFHIYSMRQAIEENFILDVLKNYMTYNMYFKIAKVIEDDPIFDSKQGLKAIRNFEMLHPHNIAQKTTIILEHFKNVTMQKINGNAKAMIVTSSRLHAIRYLQEFKRQIKEKDYPLDVLVAFSGEVIDKDETYTEEKLNIRKNGESVKESALPEAFRSSEFNMLIVAEKYQTGFDEPLLHTMFVDKKLSGVKAVQTLSRLNRTTRGKVDTFVLDFVNSAEDIKKAFDPYYEETVLEQETDPNIIYDIKNTLDKFNVYKEIEIDDFADLFFSNSEQSMNDLGKLEGNLRPAVDRYMSLEDVDKDLFKSTLARFSRIYAFITQVYRMFDKDMHKFSVYVRFLYKMLPRGENEIIDIDNKIMLEYYRLEKDYEGEIELEGTDDGMTTITGTAGRKEKEKNSLTDIIDSINEKHGTNFTEQDKVLTQIKNDVMKDSKWKDYSENNDFESFMLLFDKNFKEIIIDRFEQNNKFSKELLDNEELMEAVKNNIGISIYNSYREQ